MPDAQKKSTTAASKHSVAADKSNSQDKILKKRGYTLGKIIGEGSYAKVYVAEFTDAKSTRKQKLACKLINGSNAPKDFLRKFFPREVEIMSKVNHTYLIRVHSILQRKQKYFIFMQFAENGDLLDFIRANGPIKESQARVWFAQIIKGLKYLHDREIAHRDMKCENILLTATYSIKISDFGFARYTVDEQGKPITSATFCGSVSYAPPEIIRGLEYDCKLSDIWSIGIILYIMLNKSMPFDDSSLKKLHEAQMTRNWKIRTKLKDVITTEAKQLLYILLEPLPENRQTLNQLWMDKWVQLNLIEGSTKVDAIGKPDQEKLPANIIGARNVSKTYFKPSAHDVFENAKQLEDVQLKNKDNIDDKINSLSAGNINAAANVSYERPGEKYSIRHAEVSVSDNQRQIQEVLEIPRNDHLSAPRVASQGVGKPLKSFSVFPNNLDDPYLSTGTSGRSKLITAAGSNLAPPPVLPMPANTKETAQVSVINILDLDKQKLISAKQQPTKPSLIPQVGEMNSEQSNKTETEKEKRPSKSTSTPIGIITDKVQTAESKNNVRKTDSSII